MAVAQVGKAASKLDVGRYRLYTVRASTSDFDATLSCAWRCASVNRLPWEVRATGICLPRQRRSQSQVTGWVILGFVLPPRHSLV